MKFYSMKINISKKETILILAIGLIIIFVLPWLFIQPSILPSFQGKGDIGATLNGITAPFLSVFGSVLVYLALKSQIDANEEFKNQFKKQNNDQPFFRLMDNLKVAVSQYQKTDGGREFKGYEALNKIVISFNFHIKANYPDYLIDFLFHYPNEISDENYQKIVLAMNGGLTLKQIEIDADNFKLELINRKGNNKPATLESFYYLSKQQGRNGIAYELGEFYLTSSEMEKKHLWYKSIFNKIYKGHSVFYDGYLSNFKYTINLINSIKSDEDKKFYGNYIKGSLTNNEKALLYFYLFSGRKETVLKEFLNSYKILDDLEFDHYTNAPTEKFFKHDLKELLNWEGK